MEMQIVEVALSQGVWAALSVVLLFYIIRTQEKKDMKQDERELRYQKLIEVLEHRLGIVSDIKSDVADIKESVCK